MIEFGQCPSPCVYKEEYRKLKTQINEYIETIMSLELKVSQIRDELATTVKEERKTEIFKNLSEDKVIRAKDSVIKELTDKMASREQDIDKITKKLEENTKRVNEILSKHDMDVIAKEKEGQLKLLTEDILKKTNAYHKLNEVNCLLNKEVDKLTIEKNGIVKLYNIKVDSIKNLDDEYMKSSKEIGSLRKELGMLERKKVKRDLKRNRKGVYITKRWWQFWKKNRVTNTDLVVAELSNLQQEIDRLKLKNGETIHDEKGTKEGTETSIPV